MDEELLRAVKRLEQSTNRTTFAIRAFVRFLFIQISATTIGSLAGAAAAVLGWAWLGIVGGAITTFGLIWAGIAARMELKKSKP